MDLLIDRAWDAAANGRPLEIVTGNNDADAVYFLRWAGERFDEDRIAHLRDHLTAWGGNSSGVGVANIDPQGDVHPDTYWSDYTVGNVKRQSFSSLWTGDDPMLAQLRRRPRPLKGALRRLCLQGRLRRQHADPGPAAYGRPLGRGPRLLSHRHGDWRRIGRPPDPSTLPGQKP